MKVDAIRKVAFEIDEFEMKHYNEDTKGVWERVYGDLNQIDEQIHELQTRKKECLDLSEMAWDLKTIMANTRCEVDQLEHLGVQNGLIRSKHLHNFLLAARHRDEHRYHDDKIDYVEVKIPWYLENNLIEKLYLKYHETRIHRVFDLINKYIFDEKEEHEDWKGIYAWWMEMKEIWEDEIDDEETVSNHYHDNDTYWGYDVDPTECQNLKDFFRKRIRAKVQEKKEAERLSQEEAQQKKKQALELLRNRVRKLKRYTSLKEYGEKVKGSVYWMIDVTRKYAKDKYGMLYAGESKNFHQRYTAYEPRANGKETELEKKFKKKLPHISDAEIRNFVRDPEACKLKVITNTRLSNAEYRLAWERRIIKRFKPLLNFK